MTHHDASGTRDDAEGVPCRVCSCSGQDSPGHAAGICKPCWYKNLIVILIAMIAISCVVWFGVL